jgi:outer membrane protein assembly factor BamD
MEVGRYYLRQQSYLAAINRFKSVIENFQTSSHIPEALHRLVECYIALGIKDQAQASAAVLGHNYPGSPWYADSYALVKHSVPNAVLPEGQAAQAPKKSAPTKSGTPK